MWVFTYFTEAEKQMKILSAAALLLVMASSVSGMIISADADGYNNGTDISTAFAGMTLSSVGGYPGLDGIVYAWGDGLASTGTNVFANNLSFQRQWYAELTEGFALRADFEQLANSVAIDIIGDDFGDYGVLTVYDSSGVLIDSVQSPQLAYGQVFRAIVDRPSFDIAYIIAGGSPSTEDTVHLDNLVANVIPEPTTLCLFGLGAFFLTRTRRILN